jgi:hypothetical protein
MAGGMKVNGKNLSIPELVNSYHRMDRAGPGFDIMVDRYPAGNVK